MAVCQLIGVLRGASALQLINGMPAFAQGGKPDFHSYIPESAVFVKRLLCQLKGIFLLQ